MKLAKGSMSWIYCSFFPAKFFLILYVILALSEFELGIIFLLISVFLFLLTIFFVMFFRDPERNISTDVCVVADGKIREVKNMVDEDIGDCFFVSTFMNVHNVHVNRMPFDGLIKKIENIPGGYLPAFKKESEKNERVIMSIDSDIGLIKVVQIAGTLAKRIVPYVNKGDKVKKGSRIGIIRLGSRVDVYLSKKNVKKICVKVGDRVKAGEDILAEINA